jgi:hypothetical protein
LSECLKSKLTQAIAGLELARATEASPYVSSKTTATADPAVVYP